MVIAEKDELEIIGFVTERDCIRAIAKDIAGSDALKHLINCQDHIRMTDLMTPIVDMVTAKDGVSSEDYFKIMITNNIRHLPICDANFVIRNVVSIKDVAKNIVVDSME